MADKEPAKDLITITSPSGNSTEVEDTVANRKLAAAKGFEVSQGIVKSVGEFARGADEMMSAHDIVNYNPLTWIEHGAFKGIAAATGAKTDEELRKESRDADYQKVLEDRKTGATPTVYFRTPSGNTQEVADTEENRALAKERGFVPIKPEDITTQGARGSAKAYSEGVFNEMLFGLPKMTDEDLKKRMTDLDEHHATAATLGSAAGIAANMSMPVLNMGGAVGKAEKIAEKSLVKIGLEGTSLGGKVVQGAIKAGVGGAVISAPHAAGQAVFEDPAKAGEGMLYGIGIGAVLGGAGPLASKVFETILPAAQQAAEHTADTRLMKNLGLERATLKKMGGAEAAEDIGRTLNEAGIIKPGMTQAQMLAAVDELGEKSGKQIGDILTHLDGAVAKNPELAQYGFDSAKVVQRINDEIAAGKLGPHFTSDMKLARDAMRQVIASTSGKDVKFSGELIDQLQRVAEHGETLSPASFEKAQELKTLFRPEMKSPTALTDKDILNRKVYGIITDEMNQAAQRVAERGGMPEMASGYDLARKQYAAVMRTAGARENLLAAQEGNRFFSPSDYGVGGLGSLLGVGHAVAHGASALASGGLGLVAGYAGKKILESGPVQSTMISGADRLAQSLRAMTAADVAAKVERLEEAISGLANRASHKRPIEDRSNQPSPIATILGSDERDGAKALAEFQKRVEPLVNDPDKMNQLVGSIGNQIAGTGDSDAAFHWAQGQVRALNYLYEQSPKQRINPSLFYNPEYRPTKAEISRFEEICQIASDPFHVVRKIEDGKLSKDDLATLKAIYPEMNDLISQRIQSMGYDHQLKAASGAEVKNLPYDVRQRLERLSGAYDPSREAKKTAQLQQGYGPPPANGTNIPAPGKSKPPPQTQSAAEKLAT